MPNQPAPFWLCHECGAQMRPLMVDGVPHCASCNGEFLEILDEEVNPDPFHELPHPPTRPGLPPPPVPPNRPGGPFAEPLIGPYAQDDRGDGGGGGGGDGAGGGFLSTLLESVFGRLDNPQGTAGPPTVPPRPGTEDANRSPPGSGSGSNDASTSASPSSSRGPRTRTYNWGNASFTITTGSSADLFGTPSPRHGSPNAGNPWVGGFAGAPGDSNDGLDAYFRGFGAPPPRGGRPLRPEEASGQILLQALFDLLAEDGAGPIMFPGQGRFGDYVMTEEGYNDILERLMQAAGPQGPLPATDAVIEGLPKVKFDEKSLAESPYKDCPVCMEDFTAEDTVTKLPCKHIFHPDCLTPWLKNNGSCPVCRFSLVPTDGSAAPRSSQPGNAGEGEQGQGQGQGQGQRDGENRHRGPLATAQDFISNSFNMLHRLWGQAGTASAGESGAGSPSQSNPAGAASTSNATSAGQPSGSTSASAEQQIDEATANLQRAAAEQSAPDHATAEPEHIPPPAEYHPGVFPGHHPDVPDPQPRRFVRRASTLSNSFVPSDTDADRDAEADDPPDTDLADLDPPVSAPTSTSPPQTNSPPSTGYNPGMSGMPSSAALNSAIPADYRARHAQREREQHEREERERAAAGHPYWDDDVD